MGESTLHVEGNATAEVEPDVMVVALEVTAGCETARAARDRERDHRRTLLESLEGLIADDATTITSKYVGESKNAFDSTVEAAYTARSTIEVRCRPDDLDAVVGLATEAEVLVERVEARVAEGRRESIRTNVLEAATANAREQAETLAAAADRRLGPVQWLSTADTRQFESVVDDIMASDVSADYSVGPVELAVVVEATYALEPPAANDD